MLGGDDDEVEELPEDITDSDDEGRASRVMDISIEMQSKNNTINRAPDGLLRANLSKAVDNTKFLALYDDAKHRNLR